MSLIFTGAIENFDQLFRKEEKSSNKESKEVFMDPNFMNQNESFRKLFSKISGRKEDEFQFKDLVNEDKLTIKFKNQLLRKINYLIVQEENKERKKSGSGINLVYYRAVKTEIDATANRRELEKINNDLEKNVDMFRRIEVENLVREARIVLNEINSIDAFKTKDEVKEFNDLINKITDFIGFINLYDKLERFYQKTGTTPVSIPLNLSATPQSTAPAPVSQPTAPAPVSQPTAPAPVSQPTAPVVTIPIREKYKIMSYNVLDKISDESKRIYGEVITDQQRQNNIKKLISDIKPDILACQEAPWLEGADIDNLVNFNTNRIFNSVASVGYPTLLYYDFNKFDFMRDSKLGSGTRNLGVKLRVRNNGRIVNFINIHLHHFPGPPGKPQGTNTMEKIAQDFINTLDDLNFKLDEELIILGDSNEFYDKLLEISNIPTRDQTFLSKYPEPYRLNYKGQILNINFKDPENGFTCCRRIGNPNINNHKVRSDIIGVFNRDDFRVFIPREEVDLENRGIIFSDHKSIISSIEL